MIKICVFDLDGTLADTITDLTDSANYALRKHNLPEHTKDAIKSFVGNGVHDLIRAMIPVDRYSEALHQQVFKDYNAYYLNHYCDKTVCYPHIEELLTQLEKMHIAIAVLSNKPHEFTNKIMTQIFNKYHFATIMGHSDQFPRKPDPQSLLEILRICKYSTDETFFIGDSDVDMKTARNAGILPIGVTWGYRSRDVLQSANAEYIIDDPLDLISIINA